MSSLQAQQRYAREKQVSIELALKSQAAPPAPARAAAAPRIRPGMNSAQLGAALYEALAGGSEGESDDAQSDSSAAESSVASSAPSSGRSGMTESQRKYAEIHDRADATRKDIYKNDDIDPVVSKNIDRSWKQLRKMNLSTAGKMDHAIDDINSITTGVAPAEPSKPGAARQKESTARGAGDGFLPTEACSDLVESGLAPDVVAQANGKIPRLGPLPGYSTTLSSQFGEQRVTMRGCGQALVLRTEIASGGGSRRTILLRGYPHVRPLVDSVEPNFATVGLDAQPYDSREGDFTYTIRNSRLTGGQVLSTVCSGVRLRASAPEFDYKVSCVTDGFTEVFELAIDASNEFSWRLDHGGTHTAFVSDDAPRRSSGGGSKISSASPKHK
ncbi:hypothetical protein [Variovorax sp. Sphag1AA]|uniref:hypothetical protein n=1 Tax=Variovorax sp. Sphag1AA TaxID=2587027 RepID=UPI00160BE6EF|nr:hypothetical protein [Variovorax sp. Sphag1AA]MBB3182022.1 hypothetical protein [Variovorax sp. Sphag1AA]